MIGVLFAFEEQDYKNHLLKFFDPLSVDFSLSGTSLNPLEHLVVN